MQRASLTPGFASAADLNLKSSLSLYGGSHRTSLRLCFALLAMLIGGAAAAAVARQDNSAGVPNPITQIHYGADRSFMPFEGSDPISGAVGFQVDLIRAIGIAMNVSVSVKAGTWDDMKSDLLADRIHVVGMFDQPDRRDLFDFSDAFAVEGSEIFVRDGGRRYASIDDLKGRHVIVQRGGLACEILTAAGTAAEIVEVETEEDAIVLLAGGRYDAAVVTSVGGYYAIEKGGIGNVTSASPVLLKSDVCFAVVKGRSDLRALINEGIARVKSSGEYNRIYEKWLSHLGRPAIALRKAMITGSLIVGPLLALVGAVMMWNRSLKRSVAAKTARLREELQTRREVEEDLRESEQRFRVALKSASIMVASQDRSLRHIWVYNPLFAHVHEPLVGKTDREILPAHTVEVLEGLKHRVIDSGQGATREVEIDESGPPRQFRIVVEPLRTDRGEIIGVTYAAVDVSDLKRAQERARDLDRRSQQAERLESLGLLAGGVAHDFNNLLTAILGNAELAIRDLEAGSRAASHVEAIEQTARTAAEITGQLFAFTGKGGTRREPVLVNEIVREIVRGLAPSLSQSIEIETDLASNVPAIDGDPAQIRQALLNLITNAAEAMNARGDEVASRSGGKRGRLVIATRWEHVDESSLRGATLPSVAPSGKFVSLAVRDTGCGITTDRMARIFDPFYTTKSNGKGLGLAVVAGVARRHRAAVQVESTPGSGTTFRMLFPIQGLDEAASADADTSTAMK